MNKTKLLLASASIFLVQFSMGCGQVYAQNTISSAGLDAKELEAINRQPISPKVRANENVLGTEKRQASFDYQENQGTHVKEYTSNGRPVEIQVDSRAGTKYEMSRPLNSNPSMTNTNIERVPSLKVPF